MSQNLAVKSSHKKMVIILGYENNGCFVFCFHEQFKLSSVNHLPPVTRHRANGARRQQSGLGAAFPSGGATAVSLSTGCSVLTAQRHPGEHPRPAGGPQLGAHR